MIVRDASDLELNVPMGPMFWCADCASLSMQRLGCEQAIGGHCEHCGGGLIIARSDVGGRAYGGILRFRVHFTRHILRKLS